MLVVVANMLPTQYYTSSLFGLIVKFGLSVFYFFGRSVKNLVLQFSISSVPWIWSTGPAGSKTYLWGKTQVNKSFAAS